MQRNTLAGDATMTTYVSAIRKSEWHNTPLANGTGLLDPLAEGAVRPDAVEQGDSFRLEAAAFGPAEREHVQDVV